MAESVAVESRKQNNLPDRRIGRIGRTGRPDSPRELEDYMQAFGMLLLAAATAGDGFGYADPGVGGKKWLRHHLVSSTDATGPPPYTAASMAGAGGMGAASGRRFTVTKSQIYFLDPNGMQIGWQNGTGPNGERTYLPAQLTVPARYNFNQGYIYRLKITNIPAGPPSLSIRRSRSPRRPRRPTPTWPTTRSPCSSPPKTSTRWSTAATS